MPDTLVPDTLVTDIPAAPSPAGDDAVEELRRTMPIALGAYDTRVRRTGLVIVDEVNGFCTVGCGPLAPPAPNEQVSRMVAETDRLARAFTGDKRPVAAFLDTHIPGKPEPPYPPHCEVGTGQENLVPELEWLDGHPQVTLIRKDCINGFVGSIESKDGSESKGGGGRNRIVDWIDGHRLEAVVVVGICTDICVMDFVLTLLSARNHGMTPTLKDIVVYEPGCATYDLPLAVARAIGLPDTAAHPQAATHHLGLYFMASRGAILANALS